LDDSQRVSVMKSLHVSSKVAQDLHLSDAEDEQIDNSQDRLVFKFSARAQMKKNRKVKKRFPKDER